MSRDFILILAGGLVSLVTTMVVLFVSDYIYRRDELLYRKSLPPPRTALELSQDINAQAEPSESKDSETKPLSPADPEAAAVISSLEESTLVVIKHPEATAAVASPSDGKNAPIVQTEVKSEV